MKERGMVKWAPYKSLNQQADYLSKMAYERNKKTMPQLSIDQREEINDLLSHYHQQNISLRYFRDGYFYTEKGQIKRTDSTYRFLTINGVDIYFCDVVSILDAASETISQDGE
jgi:hypothetical protein